MFLRSCCRFWITRRSETGRVVNKLNRNTEMVRAKLSVTKNGSTITRKLEKTKAKSLCHGILIAVITKLVATFRRTLGEVSSNLKVIEQ